MLFLMCHSVMLPSWGRSYCFELYCCLKFVYFKTALTSILVSYLWQEMSAPIMDGHDTVTGHIISTTIGGKNGEPKQVELWFLFAY